jgi:hypothetical protein
MARGLVACHRRKIWPNVSGRWSAGVRIQIDQSVAYVGLNRDIEDRTPSGPSACKESMRISGTIAESVAIRYMSLDRPMRGILPTGRNREG